MAKRYRCTKALILNYFDSDGGSTEDTMTVEAGEVFEECNRYPYNIVGSTECVHLENDDGGWIEILPDTLMAHFVEVLDDGERSEESEC